MDLKFQYDALQELSKLAQSDRHSILLEGPAGCGKSYVSKQYVKMLNILDFSSVQPSVQGVRDALDASYDFTEPIVFCIENLDLGVPAASYTLLKFLEEPVSTVYIIVTCRNRSKIPDTIISRSTCVTISAPSKSDIDDFAMMIDIVKFNQLSKHSVWKAVKSLNDIDFVYRLNSEQLDYYNQFNDILSFKDTVSNIIWKLGHYPNNEEIDTLFMFNYIVSTCESSKIKHYAMQAAKDVLMSRIASHAVLAKFVLECKYGE